MGKCILCQNSKFEILAKTVRDSDKHKIVKCKKCEHIQLYPIPSDVSYKKFYDENRQIKNIKFDFNIKQLKKKSEFDVKRRLHFIQKNNLKKDRILEVGSGNGFLLKKLFELGYDVIGIEISKERRKVSESLSAATVINYNTYDGPGYLGKFDSIAMFQVLEHIPNPKKFLKQLRKFLKKDGSIIIEVPNVDDFQLSLNQSYKNWFWQKAHVNYFSAKILARILKEVGFSKAKVSGIQRYSIENMFIWKLTDKPQPISPTYELPKEYSWIESHYKKYLQKRLICDTLFVTAKK